MKKTLMKRLALALAGLMFAVSGSIASAQVLASTNILFTFDTGDQTAPFTWGTNTTFPVFSHWYGAVGTTFSWDGTQDAQSNSLSGSFRLDESWPPNDQYAINFLWDLMQGGQGGGANTTVDMSLYAFEDLDIKIDPSSTTNNNGNYGVLQLIADINYSQTVIGTFTIPQSATNWTHIHQAIPPGLGLSWGPAFIKQGFGANGPNGPVTMWMDNLAFTSIIANPAIATQPVDQEIYAGKNVNMTLTVVGLPPYQYQWYKGNTPALGGTPLTDGPTGSGSGIIGSSISNAISTLTITNIQPSDATLYCVVVTNNYGSVTSRLASVKIVTPANAGAYAQAVIASGPVAFYELNETNNPTTLPGAYDHIGGFAGVYRATVSNAFNGVVGPRYKGFTSNNAAITLPANVSARIGLPALNLNTNTVTITCWINPRSYPSSAGIVFCRSGSTTAGLDWAGGSVLGYTWNNEQPSWSWQGSGANPPLNQWSFVALVMDPTVGGAFIYCMNPSIGILTPGFNPVAPVNQAFGGETRIGNDGNNATARTFDGSIDDVAIYNRALSAVELQNLYFAAGLGPTLLYDPTTSSISWNLIGGVTGTLQEATSLTGPWTPTAGSPTSPYTLPLTGPQKFYKVSVP
jgi:Concanavalin A-like lectin/glucanases superfamily/Immunoglobulin I-set domain